MTPTIINKLVDVAERADAAGHGGKQAIYAQACADLGLSLGTLHRYLKKVRHAEPRRQRQDAGASGLTAHEALTISTLLIETTRKNGKALLSMEQALAELRANQVIRAERVNARTGEVTPLSVSAVSRALRAYGMHPEQINQPAPVMGLKTEHPNQLWQIDASLCVLYYLRREEGLRTMPHAEFYKNKPANLAKIENDRVWRYAVTDHTSGWVYVEYVFGAESAENLCNIFLNAIHKRDDRHDPVFGVPFRVMLDPGSANTSAMFKGLCLALQTEVLVNTPKNARAKGQVEGAHNLIECSFESTLSRYRVESLADLNAQAGRWMRWFNGTQIHSRHGMTRYGAWLTISKEQLRVPPGIEICRELARTKPEDRKVTPELTIHFGGAEYDVSRIAGLLVGQKLSVVRAPLRTDAVQVMWRDEHRHTVFHVVEPVAKDRFGFRVDAREIGSYRGIKETPAQRHRREMEMLATDTTTTEAAEKARKQKLLPFGGKLDPFKHMDETPIPTPLPRHGTALAVPTQRVEAAPISAVQFAIRYRRETGSVLSESERNWLAARYPKGIPEDQADQMITELTTRQRNAANGA
jgi:hypothetical protein